MPKFPKSFVRHEVPRATPDRTIGVYCKKCGREIQRFAQSTIRSVSKCAICIAKENGVLNPEDHILPQYTLSSDSNRIPMPVPTEEEMMGGVLLLDPESQYEETGVLPQSGGVVGTVRAIFRAFGFAKLPKQVEKESIESTPSLQRARTKRNKGLFADE